MSKVRTYIAAAAVVSVLAACGGGSTDDLVQPYSAESVPKLTCGSSSAVVPSKTTNTGLNCYYEDPKTIQSTVVDPSTNPGTQGVQPTPSLKVN